MSPIPLGILAASGAAGAIPAYDHISTTNFSGGSVTLTGLLASAADYKHLELRARIAATSGSLSPVNLIFNGSTSGYSWHRFAGLANGTLYSQASASDTKIFAAQNIGTDSGSNDYTGFFMKIPNFQDTTKTKQIRTQTGAHRGGGSTNTSEYAYHEGAWNNLAAIDSITLTSAFRGGSVISVYGVRG